MGLMQVFLPRWDEPYEPPVTKTYEEIYGERLRQRKEELRAMNRYLPEMKKPHWNSRKIHK